MGQRKRLPGSGDACFRLWPSFAVALWFQDWRRQCRTPWRQHCQDLGDSWRRLCGQWTHLAIAWVTIDLSALLVRSNTARGILSDPYRPHVVRLVGLLSLTRGCRSTRKTSLSPTLRSGLARRLLERQRTSWRILVPFRRFRLWICSPP